MSTRPMPEVVYRGVLVPEIYAPGEGGAHVEANGRPLSPAYSQRVRWHSPTGFSWGYCGSGPAQLALALLLHATRGRRIAETYYQHYKQQVVARWPVQGWTTTRTEILCWVDQQLKEHDDTYGGSTVV